jgi:hypothetical protein
VSAVSAAALRWSPREFDRDASEARIDENSNLFDVRMSSDDMVEKVNWAPSQLARSRSTVTTGPSNDDQQELELVCFARQ